MLKSQHSKVFMNLNPVQRTRLQEETCIHIHSIVSLGSSSGNLSGFHWELG